MADEVKLNLEGLNVLMKAQQPMVDRIGRRWAQRAGEGFQYRTDPGDYTARGYVETSTPRGRAREARDKVILRTAPKGE